MKVLFHSGSYCDLATKNVANWAKLHPSGPDLPYKRRISLEKSAIAGNALRSLSFAPPIATEMPQLEVSMRFCQLAKALKKILPVTA